MQKHHKGCHITGMRRLGSVIQHIAHFALSQLGQLP
jgi:hypothetical protein